MNTKQKQTMKAGKFGVEIEVASISKEAALRAVHSVVGGTLSPRKVTDEKGRDWNVVGDSSIRPHGCEVVSPPLKWNDIEKLQEVVRALRRAGAVVNESCGMHVHVGASRFTHKATQALVGIIGEYEEQIFKMTNDRGDRYCKRLGDKARVVKGANGSRGVKLAWYEYQTRGIRQKYHSSRYHGLNLHSLWFRGTVEFRYFDGTLHAGKVKSFVQLALGLMAKARLLGNGDDTEMPEDRGGLLVDYLGLDGADFRTLRTVLVERRGLQCTATH